MAKGYKEAQRRIQQAIAEKSPKLDLSRLELSAVPPEIGQLKGLQWLDLSANELTAVPPEIGQFKDLQSLFLNNNQLTAIPPEIGQLTGLQSLFLYENKLTAFPPEISKLTNLTSLWLGNNKLTTIPPEIAQLTKLQSLEFQNSQLTIIPLEITQLTNLQSIYLNNNQLNTIPSEFAKLTKLTKLNIWNNELTAVPPELGQLMKLQSLDLSVNKLTNIPAEIGQLMELRKFALGGNKLTAVPEWLVQMPQLVRLHIGSNPITQPPPELLGKALTADPYDEDVFVDLEVVRRYYAQLAKEGDATIYEAKLLLIGEGGAGKTSLARKLMDTANPLPPPDDSTKGVDVHPWSFSLPSNHQPPATSNQPPTTSHYQANIWDFGGQAIYKNTHQFFLSKRSVYVLLTDTRRESDFYDWLRMQEAFGADSPILILKNQNRQHGNQCIIENLPQLQERFPNMQEIIQLDLSGVPDTEKEAWADFLHYLQRHLLNLDHIGKPIPRTWVAVREELARLSAPLSSGGAGEGSGEGKNSISRRDYLALCAEQGIADPADALQLSQFLHDIGDILHYQNDPGPLADLIILNPTWALDAVYRVLDNKQISDDWGQFSYRQLQALWDEPAYDGHQDQLLALMRRFQLCYELPHKRGHYIAPQMLKPEVPPYEWDTQPDDLQLRFHYPHFMPRGILNRAVVVLHEYIEEQQLVWRSGVILNDKHARAQLLELRGEKEIRIRISGSRRLDFLMHIVQTLDKLHEGFSSKLAYEKRVPCRCPRCIQPENTPHFFDLEYLRDRLASPNQDKWVVECRYKPFHEIHVRNLIDDAILQMDRRGGNVYNIEKYVGGDNFEVGDISDAQDVAIGKKASASTSS